MAAHPELRAAGVLLRPFTKASVSSGILNGSAAAVIPHAIGECPVKTGATRLALCLKQTTTYSAAHRLA